VSQYRKRRGHTDALWYRHKPWKSRRPRRSTEGGQHKEALDGIRAYKVRRARIDLKGKVLAIAAYMDRSCVDASQEAKDRQYNDARERREPKTPLGKKKTVCKVTRRLAKPTYGNPSDQGQKQRWQSTATHGSKSEQITTSECNATSSTRRC
jgi:hypothetical protein